MEIIVDKLKVYKKWKPIINNLKVKDELRLIQRNLRELYTWLPFFRDMLNPTFLKIYRLQNVVFL